MTLCNISILQLIALAVIYFLVNIVVKAIISGKQETTYFVAGEYVKPDKRSVSKFWFYVTLNSTAISDTSSAMIALHSAVNKFFADENIKASEYWITSHSIIVE